MNKFWGRFILELQSISAEIQGSLFEESLAIALLQATKQLEIGLMCEGRLIVPFSANFSCGGCYQFKDIPAFSEMLGNVITKYHLSTMFTYSEPVKWGYQICYKQNY